MLHFSWRKQEMIDRNKAYIEACRNPVVKEWTDKLQDEIGRLREELRQERERSR